MAIQNAGAAEDGDIVLRLTVFSGNSTETHNLADEVLSPGSFEQFSSILASDGLALTNGYVRIERVSGRAPYYAYAVINDQANADVSAKAEDISRLEGERHEHVPAYRESSIGILLGVRKEGSMQFSRVQPSGTLPRTESYEIERRIIALEDGWRTSWFSREKIHKGEYEYGLTRNG